MSCCRAQKMHYVTPEVFERARPLPTLCGSTRAAAVTVTESEVDCLLCRKKLKDRRKRD